MLIYFGIIIFVLGIFFLGFYTHILYESYNYQRQVDGLYFHANLTHQEAMNIAKEYDYYGDWVCINIRGMSFDDAKRSCSHECMHAAYTEIIAEHCEDNFEKCTAFLDNFKNSNNS
jgi:hypothetical protein